MSDASIEERRKAAYTKLGEVVQELSELDDLDPNTQDNTANIPTAWALVVGFDLFDETMNPAGGLTALYPKDGVQPHWKTVGLIATILGRLV